MADHIQAAEAGPMFTVSCLQKGFMSLKGLYGQITSASEFYHCKGHLLFITLFLLFDLEF
jgi:hypothetical protein